ncbi:MAG: amidophosphoribosyltransferase [Aigarchaeota archaeon]|nr:amidophosphoribosyltransferase [Aigarchaeota archaeon]MDW8092719.1 amidophosphoribosyltransferase [Nitrososphaerota archaeon]
MREKCGIVMARSYSGHDVSGFVVNGLKALQHRGQEGWGVSLSWKFVFRRGGLVSHAEREFYSSLPNERFTSGIGHVRYSTVGGAEYIQPLDIGESFRIAHNGTIANYQRLALECGLDPRYYMSDTLVAGVLIEKLLTKREGDWVGTLNEFVRVACGSFCFAIQLPNSDVIAVRDPMGFRPLCLGHHNETDTYVVASESCALDVLGADLIRDVKPGEAIIMSKDGVESVQYVEQKESRICAFEYVYFAHPSSIIEGASVYEVRRMMGKLLAEKYPLNGDLVVPVPESARPAALGFAEARRIPIEEALVKYRYFWKGRMRGFIEPKSDDRNEVSRWIIPIKSAVKDKEVILVEDSIVRGTTAKEIVETMRRAGAKRVGIVVTFPPIAHPCFMGIDFPDRSELIAHKVSVGTESGIEKTGERVAREIGADYVLYNDPETLARAIGRRLGQICVSCVTGDYGQLVDLPLTTTRREFKGG